MFTLPTHTPFRGGTGNPRRPTTLRTIGRVALAAAVAVTIAACGDDDAGADHGAHDPDEPMEITVDGVDYGFENLPKTVPAGTQLSFRNTAEAELHELVVFRLPDDNATPLAELVELPPEELTPILGAPVAVLLQAPGSSDVIPAVGDGTITEPGRYAVMCFIPQGADPAEYLQKAAESDGGPPQGVAGGPPHFVYGMFAELEVTEA